MISPLPAEVRALLRDELGPLIRDVIARAWDRRELPADAVLDFLLDEGAPLIAARVAERQGVKVKAAAVVVRDNRPKAEEPAPAAQPSEAGATKGSRKSKPAAAPSAGALPTPGDGSPAASVPTDGPTA